MTTIVTSRCNTPLDLIALREISERAQHSRPRKCISDVTTAYTINLEMKEDKIKKIHKYILWVIPLNSYPNPRARFARRHAKSTHTHGNNKGCSSEGCWPYTPTKQGHIPLMSINTVSRIPLNISDIPLENSKFAHARWCIRHACIQTPTQKAST